MFYSMIHSLRYTCDSLLISMGSFSTTFFWWAHNTFFKQDYNLLNDINPPNKLACVDHGSTISKLLDIKFNYYITTPRIHRRSKSHGWFYYICIYWPIYGQWSYLYRVSIDLVEGNFRGQKEDYTIDNKL